MNKPDRTDDEERQPVYPQRPTSRDTSSLEWLLGLIPGRLLLGLLLILCGTIPYFGLAVYVVVFVVVVAFIMYVFHLAYAAKPTRGEQTDVENEDAENDDADLLDSPYDDPWPPYDER